MRRNSRQMILIMVFVSICVTICLLVICKKDVTLILYDSEKKLLYEDKSMEPIIENIVNPSPIDKDEIYGVFLDRKSYIGCYNFVDNTTEICVYVEQLATELNEEVVAEEICNIQCISKEPTSICFVMNDKLYKYDVETGVSILWEFSKNMPENPYYWLNDEQILLLDEHEAVDDWKFWLFNIETGEKVLIDNHVTSFIVAEEIIYGKKFYMGSWCEWEVCFLDRNLEGYMKKDRSKYCSIGEVVYGVDRKVYIITSTKGIAENNKEIYQYVSGIGYMRKVEEIPRESRVIGIGISE